jgi:hypothetical protein
MLVIVAHRFDDRARRLAERWAAHDARVMTSGDLSTPGWSHRVGSDGTATTVVIGGRAVASKDIAGVLTCVGAITEHELVHVVPEDRAYVAAEMTALLVAWLSRLECPVMNRPTPGCLSGPSWHPAQWIHAAGELGIPARPVRRRVRLAVEAPPVDGASDLIAVAVVGDAKFGEGNLAPRDHARRLARAAGVELLTAYFDGQDAEARLAAIDLGVDIARPEIADAILAQLTRRAS